MAIRFKPTIDAWKNLSATVLIVCLHTHSSMPTHPDRHKPNGAVESNSTLVFFLAAYFEHKRLVAFQI